MSVFEMAVVSALAPVAAWTFRQMSIEPPASAKEPKLGLLLFAIVWLLVACGMPGWVLGKVLVAWLVDAP